MSQHLSNPPLIEAILELKWELKKTNQGMSQDPAYPLFIGRLYDQVKKNYPFEEKLPATQIPDELSPYIVKYRFRKTKRGWPLVQAGPGVATLNFTDQYNWGMFLVSAKEFFPKLISSYCLDEQFEAPNFSSILLRYINAVEIDVKETDIIEFLSSKLHIKIKLPDGIINSGQIAGFPEGLNLNLPYPIQEPKGTATLRFNNGSRSDKPAIIWELNLQSIEVDVPQNQEDFEKWLSGAHEIIESWFFTLIEGDLREKFGGE